MGIGLGILDEVQFLFECKGGVMLELLKQLRPKKVNNDHNRGKDVFVLSAIIENVEHNIFFVCFPTNMTCGLGFLLVCNRCIQ